jgi:hypothetical protein
MVITSTYEGRYTFCKSMINMIMDNNSDYIDFLCKYFMTLADGASESKEE